LTSSVRAAAARRLFLQQLIFMAGGGGDGMDCWWEFAFGVKAVAAAVGKELGQGLMGIFGARGLGYTELEIKGSLFSGFGYPVFTGCPPIF
jgi:hypothetical protein